MSDLPLWASRRLRAWLASKLADFVILESLAMGNAVEIDGISVKAQVNLIARSCALTMAFPNGVVVNFGES